MEKQLGVIRCRGNTGQARRDRSPFLSTLKAQPQSLVLSAAYLLPKAEPAAAPVGAQEGNSVRHKTWPPQPDTGHCTRQGSPRRCLPVLLKGRRSEGPENLLGHGQPMGPQPFSQFSPLTA